MRPQDIRKEFPILCTSVYNKQLIYLDSAATMQRPNCVVDKWKELSLEKNANIHRSMYYLAEQATQEYEESRDRVKSFLNAFSRNEIVFTSGATAALNTIAFSLGEAFVGEGDEIIISEMEHHSNIVPWQFMAKRKKAKIVVWKMSKDGFLALDDLKEIVNNRTKIVAFTHVSNVLGLVNPCKDICNFCREKSIISVVDGSQAIVHEKLDVQQLGCDFYVFSGHKIYSLTGTGAFYGKKDILDRIPPYMGGGEMIETVTFEESTFTSAPLKFEAGTPNFTGISCLKTALDFAETLRDEELLSYYEELKKHLQESLVKNERIQLIGNVDDLSKKYGIFSFSVKGIHHQDLALVLDKMGVAVRSGHLCAQPLLSRFNLTGLTRVSLALYNTEEEVEKFIKALDRAVNMLSNE